MFYSNSLRYGLKIKIKHFGHWYLFVLLYLWNGNSYKISVESLFLEKYQLKNLQCKQNLFWITVVLLLSYSCMFQVEVCSQQLEICKSVCMSIIHAIVVETD
jgi:hypothetical protein